jgi:uncharacterized glyoxalase superfamily protein PhnB
MLRETETSTIIPGMRYRDALKMIELVPARLRLREASPLHASETIVAHAQFSFGNGMIRLGSVDNTSAVSQRVVQPDEINDRETKNTNLIVSDSAPIYATAKAVGAEMVSELAEMPYGGKFFTCRDPEGHLWSIGEYDRPCGQSMRNRLCMKRAPQ